jgi:hypothetical protein
MDANFQPLDTIVSIAIFFAAIPALWVSGRLILRSRISGSHLSRLFLWLILGGFFLIPLVDLISYFRDIFQLLIPSNQNVTEFPLFLGKTSWLLYSTIAIAMGIVVYSFAIYFGKRIITQHKLPVVEELHFSSLEQVFIVLGFAGLFNYMIKGIVVNFLWMRIPVSASVSFQGFIGSFIGWIIAFLVLAIAIFVMNGQLDNGIE